MAFSGSGTGTSGDPYQVETVTHVDEIENGGFYYEFQNDIDYGNGKISRVGLFDSFIDLNGFTLSNIDLDLNVWLKEISGGIENGTLHFNASRSNKISPFDIDGGYVRKLKITGSITSTSADAAGLSEFVGGGSTVEDIIILADVSGATVSCGSVIASQVNTFNRIVYAGTLSGSGTMIGLSNDNDATFNDSFWNTSLNPSATSVGGTGKTTSELQTLSTYNNTATTGLDSAWDIVDLSSHNGQEATAIWGIDDGNAYPILYFEVEVDTTSPLGGNITLSANPEESVEVGIWELSTLSFNLSDLGTPEEVVSTDVNGDWEGTHDPTKTYFIAVLHNKLRESGTASGGSLTSLDDSSKAMTVDEHAGRMIEITGGTGSGQMRKIASNTSTSFTPDVDFDTAPDNTSTYEVYDMYGATTRILPVTG